MFDIARIILSNTQKSYNLEYRILEKKNIGNTQTHFRYNSLKFQNFSHGVLKAVNIKNRNSGNRNII